MSGKVEVCIIVVYLGWRLVDIYLGTGHNAKPASHEIRDTTSLPPAFKLLIFLPPVTFKKFNYYYTSTSLKK